MKLLWGVPGLSLSVASISSGLRGKKTMVNQQQGHGSLVHMEGKGWAAWWATVAQTAEEIHTGFNRRVSQYSVVQFVVHRAVWPQTCRAAHAKPFFFFLVLTLSKCTWPSSSSRLTCRAIMTSRSIFFITASPSPQSMHTGLPYLHKEKASHLFLLESLILHLPLFSLHLPSCVLLIRPVLHRWPPWPCTICPMCTGQGQWLWH